MNINYLLLSSLSHRLYLPSTPTCTSLSHHQLSVCPSLHFFIHPTTTSLSPHSLYIPLPLYSPNPPIPLIFSYFLSLSQQLFPGNKHHPPPPTPSKSLLSPSNSIKTPPCLQIQLAHMKTLIRRLSRVADSSQYSLLRSGSTATSTTSSCRPRRSSAKRSKTVPEGHVPVYVGEEMERFVVSAELLNHPVFVGLLNKSAQEYGYEQKGVLHIPCHVLVFERVMEALRLGLESRDLHDLLCSNSEEDYF